MSLLRGLTIIRKAMKMFSVILDKLTEGIEKCLVEVDNNKEEIAGLNDKNNKLNQAVEQATKLRQNIEKLLQ